MSRSMASPSRVLAVAILSLLVGLTGCAINTPVRLMPLASGDRPDDGLQASITHAVIEPEHRAVFDRYVAVVAAQLPRQPGLVAYSIRREVFGNEVWTLTVWRSVEDRALFFGSGLHREAMVQASKAVRRIRSVRLELRRSELPLDWHRALVALGTSSWSTDTAE